ncbi:hypothetical protein [Pedobacter sp. ASV12]|uniref:hypothetical protein n=1 Tax=Pedobacter sp. ASV12 TaxID=2795120 RepID=UPI0018EC566E|nr:hypothetical protein [Pedobacter sp. ASV12]
MKQILLLLRVVVAIVLLTIGLDNISKPSNFEVGLGLFEVVLGIGIIYRPLVIFIKKI